MRHYLDPEGRRVGWLLTELEHQTVGRLSDESRRSLLDEVECHLDAAIQARLELGMTLADAERESVAEFGHPKSYVDDLLRVHENADPNHRRFGALRGDRRTMLTFWIATVYMGGWALMGARPMVVPAMELGMAVLVPAFAVFSFKARRVQLVPIFVSTFAACLILTVMVTLTWNNLWNYGGMGVMPKWQASERLTSGPRIVAEIDRLLIPLEHRAALHAKYDGIFNVGKANIDEAREMMEVPVANSIPRGDTDMSQVYTWDPSPDANIRFEMSDDILNSGRVWRDEGKPVYDFLMARRANVQNDIAVISRAEAAPLFSDFPINLQQNAVGVPIWFGLWGSINFAFGGLGWFLALPPLVRRRRAV